MKNQIIPFHKHNDKSIYLLQGADFSTGTPKDLQYAGSLPNGCVLPSGGFALGRGDWIGAGAFRNSLYLEPFRNFTNIKNLDFYLDFQGSALVKIFCAGTISGAQELVRYRLRSEDARLKKTFAIGSLFSLPPNTRIFWHIEGEDEGCAIYNASFVVNAKPSQGDLRMAVLLRTFGRTEDLKAILADFVVQAESNPYYKYLLSRIDFWVLDTSGNIGADYSEEWQNKLNIKVFEGPNLGGGGNAGVVQKLFFDECDKSGHEPQEVLILDDDLQVSLETLVRHFNFCLFRSKQTLSSLPVFKKSDPHLLWEDGAYWGRMHPHHHAPANHRLLEPTLLKHGERLENPAKSDIFCQLNTCEYSTFIFLGIPTKLLRTLGYPAAFFLRGDDIELSLRAGAQGYVLFTNPNLAAWHEPGHSYAQEYMAIIHGMIINMAYSQNPAGEYLRFFEQRIAEHSAIDDLVGLDLYHCILQDLLDADSSILTTGFQKHYLARLKKFGSIEWVKTSESMQGSYEHKLRTAGHQIFHFLYPGYHPHLRLKPNAIVLRSPSAYSFRQLPPVDSAEKLAKIREFLDELQTFSEKFEEIRERWVARMHKSSREDFWQTIYNERANEINLVFENKLAGEFEKILDEDIAYAQNAQTLMPRKMDADWAQISNNQIPALVLSPNPIRSLAGKIARGMGIDPRKIYWKLGIPVK